MKWWVRFVKSDTHDAIGKSPEFPRPSRERLGEVGFSDRRENAKADRAAAMRLPGKTEPARQRESFRDDGRGR